MQRATQRRGRPVAKLMARNIPTALFFALLTLAATRTPAARAADTVVMKTTGLTLSGRVERETEEFIILALGNDGEDVGAIRIPRNTIKTVEYDVNTQLDRLDIDDDMGHYKVALWAIEKGKYPDAIRILEELDGSEDVGPERYKVLGKCYETQEQLDKALQNYSDYLKAKPDDTEIKAKVDALAAKVGPDPNATDPNATPTTKPKVFEGLEASGQWITENWGQPGKTQITEDKATSNKMVASSSEGGDKDKYAISRVSPPLLNLSGLKEMQFRIFHNSATPLNIAIAFQNEAGEFHETKQFRIPGNVWTDKTLSIDGKVYKATRNQFQEFNQELEGRERISKILFLIYGQRRFDMHIDGVFFK
jgi:tetratricopeptide (TPR) repeat protein